MTESPNPEDVEGLAERLEARTVTIDDGDDGRGGYFSHKEPDPLCTEAVDVIRSLTASLREALQSQAAEIARLRGENRRLNDDLAITLDEREAAKEDAAAAEASLADLRAEVVGVLRPFMETVELLGACPDDYAIEHALPVSAQPTVGDLRALSALSSKLGTNT